MILDMLIKLILAALGLGLLGLGGLIWLNLKHSAAVDRSYKDFHPEETFSSSMIGARRDGNDLPPHVAKT